MDKNFIREDYSGSAESSLGALNPIDLSSLIYQTPSIDQTTQDAQSDVENYTVVGFGVICIIVILIYIYIEGRK